MELDWEGLIILKERVLSGVIGAFLLVALLYLGSPFVEIAVIVLAFLAVHELLFATKIIDNKPLFYTALVGTLCLMLMQSIHKSLFDVSLYLFIVATFIIYMKNKESTRLADISVTVFLCVYVCFMFSHILYVRNTESGRMLIWFVFLCAFLTDTFAMFGGKLFGKHKLCPVLSPKKTIEGSICGIIGCVVCIFVYCMICSAYFKGSINYTNALIVGFLASIVAQLGDLSASCIKRQYGVKDYGKIMPGHGGIMDRFDSVLFVAPFVYYASYILPIFG